MKRNIQVQSSSSFSIFSGNSAAIASLDDDLDKLKAQQKKDLDAFVKIQDQNLENYKLSETRYNNL